MSHRKANAMAHIVVLGAGLGGVVMALKLKEDLGAEARITVVNLGATYSFVPSNPWVAVGWREREDIAVDLAGVFARRGIGLRPEGADSVEEVGSGERLARRRPGRVEA